MVHVGSIVQRQSCNDSFTGIEPRRVRVTVGGQPRGHRSAIAFPSEAGFSLLHPRGSGSGLGCHRLPWPDPHDTSPATYSQLQLRDEHAQKTGRTAVTQPPVVAKKHAWVVRTHSQFEDRLRSWAPQGWPLMRCFTGCNQSHTSFASLDPSYPEGNFEGNQLLGGSIGLSPLCRTQATQFARQNSDRLPPQFPMASP